MTLTVILRAVSVILSRAKDLASGMMPSRKRWPPDGESWQCCLGARFFVPQNDKSQMLDSSR